MRFKVGCSLRDLKPETICGLMVVDEVYTAHGAEAVITSVNDGNHMKRSRHYEGRAWDSRTRHLLPGVAREITAELQKRLGPVGFDIVFEGEGTPSEHIHGEYDPK